MALRRLVTGTMASRSLRRHCFAPPALGALVASGIGAGVLLASVQPQHSSPMLMSSAAAAAASTAAATRLGDFQAVTATGATVSLAEPPYSTRVALVVNVASEWGLTDTNYRELQQLQARHGTEEEGRFTVLAWPCNQFGSQEPRAAAEVQQWAATKYGVTFPIFSKVRHYAENGSQRKNEIWAPALLCDQVQVNGPEADAIWVWLKEQRPAAGLEGFLGNDIKWNFVRAGLVSSTSSTNMIIGYRAQAKFLLVDGRPVERSAPTVQCWLSADASGQQRLHSPLGCQNSLHFACSYLQICSDNRSEINRGRHHQIFGAG
jgi:glutathione peroxidase-family protein